MIGVGTYHHSRRCSWSFLQLVLAGLSLITVVSLHTNQWLVKLDNQNASEVAQIAASLGFKLVPRLFYSRILDPNEHLFEQQQNDRTEDQLSFEARRRQLDQHPAIRSAIQLEGLIRQKRGYRPLNEHSVSRRRRSIVLAHGPKEKVGDWKAEAANLLSSQDPLFNEQWYLYNNGQADGKSGLDLNVISAWAQNVTGRGVTVAILDDGIDYLHTDLWPNYAADVSYDYSSDDPYPYPRYTDDWFNSHGTRCAGEVVALAGNSVCGVGVAPGARVAGIRMLDQPVMTDLIEAAAMQHANDQIDIYSASWGPTDDGRVLDGPRNRTLLSLVNGINQGRNGKGVLYVWASGDGGSVDDCNCDGYTVSMWTISVNSVTNQGRTAVYDESCSSTLASTFSNGESYYRPGAAVSTTDLYGDACTRRHSGTSAAAPLAAGVFALALEANPSLTWRDMQHLTVLTSRRAQLYDPDGVHNWTVNGAGLEFNHLFGYGILDAGRLVELARKWKRVPERFHCAAGQLVGQKKALHSGKFIELEIDTNACLGDPDHQVNFIEHVQAFLTVKASRRGDLSIFLTSPMQTSSMLLGNRPHDEDSRAGFLRWPFMTTHTWGENPSGRWKLVIGMREEKNGTGQGNRTVAIRKEWAVLSEWSLVIHGTQLPPYSATTSPGAERITSKLATVKRRHLKKSFRT